ncbi:DNA-binding LacI/PurR family transcriptional regulator [Allocatelliglobosispora scoriae]|uniref:DNA-binding LacI/PurR family transcriptional regulator n=1 Tax=Allocatelliglobosispora scoriae TaxID=643052 RepID=A0A841C4A1_9ACTN|nr:LacI family DNA-binding transcriptional regulator [Allocatelliglobosispora scoriae]MBB5873882.1 DNA-binding LacI/PurR family transcriptional regulator [Allocatelliglobosispora scoriae]
MARQPTMGDIARRAGVSRVAVSYALNGRPGVSEELRQRILRISQEINFSANGPAQALHGGGVHAIGLTMRRPATAFAIEVFRRELISGVQMELSARGFGLALQFVADLDDELAVYRRWNGERRVGGVLICDLGTDDPRVPVLEELGLPAVVVGGPTGVGRLTSIWNDDRAAVTESVGYLVGLGHRRIARVSGPGEMLHTAERTGAFLAACASAGAEGIVVGADYTGEAGATATRRLLSSARRPTAIAYDNDVMAVAGLGVAMEMGVGVPAELSIVAWEDSPVCQVVRPALTVLHRDIPAFGAHAARLLLAVIEGAEPRSVQDHTAQLVVRASTAPPA